MIKSQPAVARFKAVRPFPLHRLPSLLKRSLSVSAPGDGVDFTGSGGLTQPPQQRSTSVTSHVLLDLLPSVRSNQFVWTYTRLLCTSSSYIAGMSFYNFIAALLSLSHEQMKIYDVLGASHPTHSRCKLMLAWGSTSVLLLLVIVFVLYVVRLSEKRFAYQIHREVEKLERIEDRIRRHQRQQSAAAASTDPHPLSSAPSAPQNGASAMDDSTVGSEDDDDESEETDAVVSFAPLPPSSQRSSVDAQPSPVNERHAELIARIKAEEDKRAVCRALISSNHQTEEDIEEDEDAEEAMEEALEAGLSAQEIAREASSQRRLLSKHDPINRISSTAIFLYRLCDLVCYYAIFVAVYAFQNTLQLSIRTDTLLWSWAYFICLLIFTLALVGVLEGRQERIGRQRLEQEEVSQSLHDRLANRRLKQLKIAQATWKKLSSFVASSCAYLLAYAVWTVMQTSLQTVVPGELLKHPLWLWFNALVLVACSGAFLVLLNVRISSALADSGAEHSSASSDTLLHLICCAGWVEHLVRRPRASTARLHIRVDILSGQVTSLYHQMSTEALSYILALSIGAALTSSLPAVPADAATYTYAAQPSSHALVIYALTCSLVLALITLWLERWVRRMERKTKEKAREVLRGRLNGRERIEIKEVPFRGPRGGAGEPLSADKERFSANTHESALYILKRQFQAERRLRGEDDEERQKRTQRAPEIRNGLPASPALVSLPSPDPLILSPAASVSSPLLSPGSGLLAQSPVYGSVSASAPPSPVMTPLLSPLASPTTDGPVSSSPASDRRAVHRALLKRTFLQEYQIAIASTLTQGFALLVAYSWVGVFSFVLYPALRRWSLLLDVGDVEIQAVWSFLTFALYAVLILGAARIFHKEEAGLADAHTAALRCCSHQPTLTSSLPSCSRALLLGFRAVALLH